MSPYGLIIIEEHSRKVRIDAEFVHLCGRWWYIGMLRDRGVFFTPQHLFHYISVKQAMMTRRLQLTCCTLATDI